MTGHELLQMYAMAGTEQDIEPLLSSLKGLSASELRTALEGAVMHARHETVPALVRAGARIDDLESRIASVYHRQWLSAKIDVKRIGRLIEVLRRSGLLSEKATFPAYSQSTSSN